MIKVQEYAFSNISCFKIMFHCLDMILRITCPTTQKMLLAASRFKKDHSRELEKNSN